MADISENRDKIYAYIGTFCFHGLLVILLMFAVIYTRIPPFPEAGGGGGLEVNLGYMDEGTGEIQPENFNSNPAPYNNKVSGLKSKQTTDNENILTQENGEKVNIKTSSEKKTGKQEVKKEIKQEIKINDPVVNPNALFKKQNSGGSEGETGKPGDQGNKDGSLYSKNHNGSGLGDGSGEGPGSGGGKGKGKGTGIGNGEGPGVDFSLKDRTSVSLPLPKDISQKEGKVVVEIKVNFEGTVVYANPGVKGSTTTDTYLCKIAMEAAMKARFNRKAGAPDQIGTITYHFVLQ